MIKALAIPALGLAMAATSLVPAQAAGSLGNGACPSSYSTLSTWPLYRNDTGALTDWRIRVYVKEQGHSVVRTGVRVFKASGPSHKRAYAAIKKNGRKLVADAGTGITDCVTWPNAGGTYEYYGSVANAKGSPAIASNLISITFRKP